MDQADNLRETTEFQKDRISDRSSWPMRNKLTTGVEYEIGKEKFREINRLPKTIEFSPGRLKCLDLIFENQNGMLYLQHDGYEVIKVSAVKPIEQGGEIVG